MQEFLRERPCVALRRAQFEVRLPAGDIVLVAVSWVEMPDEGGARDLHRLVDGDGTGNVTELSRERGRYRAVRYTGDVYASERDGTVVVNAQAEPVARRASGLALTALVNEAVR